MSGWNLAAGSITRTLACRIYRLTVVLAAAAVVAVPSQFAVGAPALAAHAAAATGAYVLTATSTGGNYAPTFTGNRYLGVRVPPAGPGYAGGSVPAESTLAGFYAQAPGQLQQRANLPTWSTLTFSDGGQDFSLGTGQVSDWQQQLDLRTGVISTTATWTAPDGHVTDLRYAVLTDRARPDAAIVRLQLIPRWSGTAQVTDYVPRTDPGGQAATASSAQPRADPLAAVDGSLATDWQPQQIASSLTVPLANTAVIQSATLDGGQEYPPPPAPNVHPPPGPVKTLRASSYDLLVSADGANWTTAVQVRGTTQGTQDELTFGPVRAPLRPHPDHRGHLRHPAHAGGNHRARPLTIPGTVLK